MRVFHHDQDSSSEVYYSDAVEANGMLFVSGCVPYDADGNLIGPGDPEGQVGATLDNLDQTLALAGYSLTDLVKINIYLTDIRDVPATFAPRRARFGGAVRPATTLVEVSGLLAPGVRVEIDAIAVRRHAEVGQGATI